ncbi:MAG: hypothetical protein HFG26_09015 [Provencibacterium sp.]|jgi:hypothetical protein|nr:hypothetical protein [Provencibacterium sp.]
MSSLDNLALYEGERLDPPAGNIQAARMLETADRLKVTIRRLEHEREGIIGLHLRHLPNNLKAQVFESYDNQIANRKQELQDISDSLAERGYIA